jgi:hypothetical protein
VADVRFPAAFPAEMRELERVAGVNRVNVCTFTRHRAGSRRV